MFDYVNKLQLALGDKARRTGLTVGAGIAALTGLGFLVAAFWSWLAWNQELGPALASLIVGGGFLLIGLIVLMMAGPERHQMPTSAELKSEVEMRLSQATEAALDKAKFKVEETVDSAQARVASLFGAAGDKVQNVASGAAGAVGLSGENLSQAKETLDQATQHRAAPAVGLAGAFAVGMAFASALKSRRSEEDLYYDDEYDDDDDDWDYRR